MSSSTIAMKKLVASDLHTLEAYARLRPTFRAQVLAHKKRRTLALGPNVTLIFEDRLTIQYQIQEMLRIERIFEPEAIEEELEAYNPLIPDGRNLKATMLLEFPDHEERRRMLAKLIGIEDRVYAEVEGFPRIFAIADEDLERSNSEKTAAVHFLRFEFGEEQVQALRNGAPLAFGIDDPRMPFRKALEDEQRAALIADFDP